MKIHTIGDSHSKLGNINNPEIIQHWISGLLCYSFGIGKLNRVNIKNYSDIEDGDIVIFCFGEIDCRCHINRFITPENDYTKIIDELIKNYVDAVKENINQFTNLTTCLYNIIPPIQKHKCSSPNSEYPFVGTDLERQSYHLYFNKKLNEECAINNFIFFDIYDKYTDDDGFLNEEYSDKNIHINDGIFICEFIKKMSY